MDVCRITVRSESNVTYRRIQASGAPISQQKRQRGQKERKDECKAVRARAAHLLSSERPLSL